MESWVHVEPISGNGNDTVNITVDTNNSSEERSTTINVETSTLNKILTIIQKGKTDMNFNVLLFSKGPTGNITAHLNGSEKTAAEVSQILNGTMTAPCFIMYTRGVSGTGVQFLFADSLTSNIAARTYTVNFPQDTVLKVTSADITES